METPLPTYRERGSVLLITLTFIIILTIAAVSVLDLSSNAYQLSMRNQLRAEGRAVAESELEYLLYQFKSTVVAGNSAANAPSLLTTICDNATVPTTDRDPFLQIHHDQGWRVQIDAYPKLTEIGSESPRTMLGRMTIDQTEFRYDDQRHGGFYTKAEIRALIQGAKAGDFDSLLV